LPSARGMDSVRTTRPAKGSSRGIDVLTDASMKYIMEPDGQTLTWTQLKPLIRYHELRSNGGLYATLKWKKMYGSLAVGEGHEGRFTYKRAGFLRPYVTVRREGANGDYAVLRLASSSVIVNTLFGPSGILEFETGHRFLFNRLSFWKSRWAFTDEQGNLVMTFEKRTRRKPTATVTVNGDFRHIPHFDVLLVLGWYVIILDYEEAEAGAGTGQYAQPSNG
jgi:hypothetical protein